MQHDKRLLNLILLYHIDLFSSEAGCKMEKLGIYQRSNSSWEQLVHRKGRCEHADNSIVRDFSVLDIKLASEADYILRIGTSLYGSLICEIQNLRSSASDSCLNILRTSDDFLSSRFKEVFNQDCPNQIHKYNSLVNSPDKK